MSLTKECFAEDEQSFEAVKCVEGYLLEDEYSEVNEDRECLLNGKNSELLQQKKLRIGSDDETLAKCHKEIALLDYLLKNSEYDNIIAKKGVHYSGQE